MTENNDSVHAAGGRQVGVSWLGRWDEDEL